LILLIPIILGTASFLLVVVGCQEDDGLLGWLALTWTKATREVSSMQTWINSQHDDGDAALKG